MGVNEITCIRLLWHQMTFEIEKRLGEVSYGVHNWERLVIWCEDHTRVQTSPRQWLPSSQHASKNTIPFLHDTMPPAINLPTFRGNEPPPSSKQKMAAELSSRIMEISARLHGVTFQAQYCICKTTECNTRKARPWGTFVSVHNLDAKSTMEL